MNYYESECCGKLKSQIDSGLIKMNNDSSKYFSLLAANYPADGSKIDWDNIPNSINGSKYLPKNIADEFEVFFFDIINKYSLTGNIIYIGDSATDFALIFDLSLIKDVLQSVLSIPQHHYLLSLDGSWCATLTMEDDIHFGFSPIIRKNS